MGQPKQLLRLGEQLLVQRATQTALAAQCHPVVVVTGAYATPVKQAVKNDAVTCTHNPRWKEGMGSSIRAGVKAVVDSYPDTEALIILLADQPLVTPQLLWQLIATQVATQQALVVSEYDDIRGVPALFHQRLFSSLLSLSESVGARKFIRQYTEGITAVPFPEGKYDVDTPDDYRRIQEIVNKPC